MSDSLLILATDELLKCSMCKSKANDPLALPCFHSFCSSCIKVNCNLETHTIICPKCLSDHSCTNGIDKSFKPSSLCQFLEKFQTNTQQEESKIEEEKEGVCSECSVNKIPAKANQTKGKTEIQEQKPILVKLALCHHCKRDLCQACRTKHYSQVLNCILNE